MLGIIVAVQDATSAYIYVTMETKIACNIVWKSSKEIFRIILIQLHLHFQRSFSLAYWK